MEVAPESIRLTFNQQLVQAFASATIAVNDGDPVSQPTKVKGEVAIVEPDLGTVGEGRWTVAYRVVSKDGHPISGTVKFTVKPTAPPSNAATSVAAPSLTPSVSSRAPGAGQTYGNRAGLYGVIVLVALMLPLGYVGIRSRRQRGSAT